MCELKIGDSVFVQSYKHNGSLHRTWSKALVVDVLDDCYVQYDNFLCKFSKDADGNLYYQGKLVNR